MVTPTGTPSLVPPTTSCREYFAHTETNTFYRRYATVLAPYAVNPTSRAAAAVPYDFMLLIYAMSQEVIPTAFLQWNQGLRGRGAHITLLHSVSKYVLRIGLPASP